MKRKTDFFQIEVAALQAIAAQYPNHHNLLIDQIASARVVERRNTGSGLFTSLVVDTSLPKLDTDRILGEIWADVEELTLPVTFILYMENGYPECLELASAGEDDTRNIDFSKVHFSLVASPNMFGEHNSH